MITTCPECDRIKVEFAPNISMKGTAAWAMPVSGGSIQGVVSGREKWREELCPECEAREGDRTMRGSAIRVVIEVERGCVTAVTADTECAVTLVDYDGLSNGTVEQAKTWSPSAVVPDGIGRDAVDTALARAESAKDETLKELME